MTNNFIDSARLYEIIIETKIKTEASRDEINKYYTTILSAIIGVLPLLNNIEEKKILDYTGEIKLSFIVIAVIGLTISISWILTLKRIYHIIKAIDKKLMDIEKDYKQKFITDLISYMQHHNSPGRVTKQEMLVPYIFGIVFVTVLLYYLGQALMMKINLII